MGGQISLGMRYLWGSQMLLEGQLPPSRDTDGLGGVGGGGQIHLGGGEASRRSGVPVALGALSCQSTPGHTLS